MSSHFFTIAFSLLISSSFAIATVDHVIIVSIDGGKPAVIQKSNMPNLKLLQQEGAYTYNAKTILPSITLPSHTSMLTGVSPSIHKITWNNWVPSKGIVKVPTVFAQAKKQNLSTALFTTKDKFKHLEIKGSLDTFWYKKTSAIDVASAAGEYLKSNRPNLLFVHFPDADVAGHAKGWGSNDQIAAFSNIDTALGIIKNSIIEALGNSNYVLIVSADHGGSGRGHGSSSSADMTIPWLAWGSIVKQGQLNESVVTMDTAATALWLLNVPSPEKWEGKPVFSAFQTN